MPNFEAAEAHFAHRIGPTPQQHAPPARRASAREMSRQYDRMVTICGPSEALSTELTVASIADCAKLCDSVQGCGAFDSNGASCFLKRHFAAANSSDLCALKGGWCGYRVVGPNVSLSDTVVVTQTHIVSPAATRRFLEAQRSIRQAGGRHYVAFLIGDEPERDRCDDPRHPRARDLLRLRQALGEDAVWCIDPPAFSAHWNDFFERTKQLPWMHELPPYEGRPQAAPHWRYRTRNSLGWNCACTSLLDPRAQPCDCVRIGCMPTRRHPLPRPPDRVVDQLRPTGHPRPLALPWGGQLDSCEPAMALDARLGRGLDWEPSRHPGVLRGRPARFSCWRHAAPRRQGQLGVFWAALTLARRRGLADPCGAATLLHAHGARRRPGRVCRAA